MAAEGSGVHRGTIEQEGRRMNRATDAIVEKVEETEQQLIDMAAAAVNASNWTIGEAASKWTERYASGRTDADFAEMIGSSQQIVNYARRIHDRFYNHGCKLKFAWRHWRAMLAWEDASDCLDWAVDMGASFDEMTAWRRARNGEDLTQPEEPVAEFTGDTAAAEPHKPIVKPEAATKAKAEREFSASPESPLNLQFALKLYCKNLRNMAADTDDAERQSTAKQLRKLADELDPPDMETDAGRCPAQKICDAVGKLTGSTYQRTTSRQKALKARWAEKWWRDNWEAAIERAAKSGFLMGRTGDRIVMSIDFFLRPDSVAKIIEGKYDNNASASSARVRSNDFEEIPHRGFD